MANKHIGSDFDKYLEEEGLTVICNIIAIKQIISYLLMQKINKNELTKTELAQKLQTSRAALDRLLDPENTSVTLNTLAKAAELTGKQFKITVHPI